MYLVTVSGSVYLVTAVTVVAVVMAITANVGFSEYRYSGYTGCRGNRVKVGYSVQASSDYTGYSANDQSKVQSVCLQWLNTHCSDNGSYVMYVGFIVVMLQW